MFPEPQDKPCPNCGGVLFTWGFLPLTPHNGIGFVSNNTPWFWSLEIHRVSARACNGCGNIQLFLHESVSNKKKNDESPMEE
jgi:hypothetical protein